jgi:replicative DNA helicase
MQHHVKLIIIDYLQLISAGSDTGGGNRTQEVSVISCTERIGKELNVPVVALSQLSRAVEARADKRQCLPTLENPDLLSRMQIS